MLQPEAVGDGEWRYDTPAKEFELRRVENGCTGRADHGPEILYGRERYGSFDRGHMGGSRHDRFRGVGDDHSADVNRRDHDSDEYHEDRRDQVRAQLRNLAREENDLLMKPNLGNTSHVRSIARQYRSLTRCVDLPVNTQSEFHDILGI